MQLEHMSNEERKIYDLVVRRFLAVLMPSFDYDETTLKAEAGEGIFTARGKGSFRPGLEGSLRDGGLFRGRRG